MTDASMAVLVASYPTQHLAETDWEVLTELIRRDALELDDAAVVVRNDVGDVAVVKDLHKPVRRGLLIGALVGALTPVGLVAAVAAGGLAGKIKALFHDGIDQATLRQIGKELEDSTAVLVLAGPPEVVDATRSTLADATGIIQREVPTAEAIRAALDDDDEHA